MEKLNTPPKRETKRRRKAKTDLLEICKSSTFEFLGQVVFCNVCSIDELILAYIIFLAGSWRTFSSNDRNFWQPITCTRAQHKENCFSFEACYRFFCNFSIRTDDRISFLLAAGAHLGELHDGE